MLVPETLAALDVAIEFAEGRVGQAERRAAREKAFQAGWHPGATFAHRRGPAKACVTAALARKASEAARLAAWHARGIGPPDRSDWWNGKAEQAEIQAAVLRDIFVYPFRPAPAIKAACFSPAVVALARTIYEDRAFDQMLDLACALERAGCTDPEILAHCRGTSPHVRGCWVVDLILGRS